MLKDTIKTKIEEIKSRTISTKEDWEKMRIEYLGKKV